MRNRRAYVYGALELVCMLKWPGWLSLYIPFCINRGCSGVLNWPIDISSAYVNSMPKAKQKNVVCQIIDIWSVYLQRPSKKRTLHAARLTSARATHPADNPSDSLDTSPPKAAYFVTCDGVYM